MEMLSADAKGGSEGAAWRGAGRVGVSAACRALAAAVAADVAQRRERWAAGEGAAVRW